MITSPFLDDMIEFNINLKKYPIFQKTEELINPHQSLSGFYFIKCIGCIEDHPSGNELLLFQFNPNNTGENIEIFAWFTGKFDGRMILDDCIVVYFTNPFMKMIMNKNMIIKTRQLYVNINTSESNPFKCFWNVTKRQWMSLVNSK